MGFHLPRIGEICSLVGLGGTLVAAEEVVGARSARHRRLLERLLRPENESYARMLADQERGFRGLRELPEYWLPPMAGIESPARLRRILAAERIQPFLRHHGIDAGATAPDTLRAWLRSIDRQFP